MAAQPAAAAAQTAPDDAPRSAAIAATAASPEARDVAHDTRGAAQATRAHEPGHVHPHRLCHVICHVILRIAMDGRGGGAAPADRADLLRSIHHVAERSGRQQPGASHEPRAFAPARRASARAGALRRPSGPGKTLQRGRVARRVVRKVLGTFAHGASLRRSALAAGRRRRHRTAPLRAPYGQSNIAAPNVYDYECPREYVSGH